eukprot:1445172-Prymnesium_polylepis.1
MTPPCTAAAPTRRAGSTSRARTTCSQWRPSRSGTCQDHNLYTPPGLPAPKFPDGTSWVLSCPLGKRDQPSTLDKVWVVLVVLRWGVGVAAMAAAIAAVMAAAMTAVMSAAAMAARRVAAVA